MTDRALRFNTNKPRYSLLPSHLLEPVVRVLEYGADKYDAWNWSKGSPVSELLDSLERHLAEYKRGATIDPDHGQSHVAAMMCNCLFLLNVEKYHPEFDDRPKVFLDKEKADDN